MGMFLLLKTGSVAAYICQRLEQYVSACVKRLKWRTGQLFSSRVNLTYPTQYMSGGSGVQPSQGLRLSFGVCPFTLYVPRKKLRQNEERLEGE